MPVHRIDVSSKRSSQHMKSQIPCECTDSGIWSIQAFYFILPGVTSVDFFPYMLPKQSGEVRHFQ